MSEALRQVVWKCDRCGEDAQAIFGIFPSCKCGSTSFKAAQHPAPTAQQCHCKDRPADQCPGEWEPGCDLGANPAHALGGRPVQQPTPCFCDQNNIGAPGVSCGDCPTRDYAQPADTIDCKSVQKRLAVQQPGAEPMQGGMDNTELLAAWKKKLPGVEPSDAQLTAFAVGVEVGFAHARDLERQDWSRVHHALAKHGVHPGRTDDHLADVIDRALAAPAQRQPLSDEEIDSLTFPFLTAELGPTAYDRAIARAIEAAHGIAAQKGEKL